MTAAATVRVSIAEHGKKDSRLCATMSIQNGVLEGLCC